VERELNETSKALDYLLSRAQVKEVRMITTELN